MKRSKLRNFLTRGFHVLVYFVAGGRIRDTQCGFKVGWAGFSRLGACWIEGLRDTQHGFKVGAPAPGTYGAIGPECDR